MADEMEQQLREKIASQKASIANLPPLTSIVDETGLSSPETKARAQLIKELSGNEEKLELLIESKRVAAVVRLQDKLHPPQNSEDCPICLETIKHINSTTIFRFYCCGGWICKQCGDEREAKYKAEKNDKMYRGKCPLCREKMPREGDYKEIGTMLLKHANKGRAWAQAYVGTWYLNGMNGFAVDKEKGLKLIQESADQRDPDGLFEMAMMYLRGEILDRYELKYESKHLHYLKEAADLGHGSAQRILGVSYKECGNEKEHLHYTTLAASQGDFAECGILGQNGLTNSLRDDVKQAAEAARGKVFDYIERATNIDELKGDEQFLQLKSDAVQANVRLRGTADQIGPAHTMFGLYLESAVLAKSIKVETGKSDPGARSAVELYNNYITNSQTPSYSDFWEALAETSK